MKNNLLQNQNSKNSCILLLLVFCGLFANSAFSQDTFTWNGSSSSNWATAANWTKTGTAGTDTYPGQTRLVDLVVINSNGSNAPEIASGTYEISRLTVTNNATNQAGATLTIRLGATIRVTNSTTVALISLNGGNIINNGTLTVRSTSTGATTGFGCGNPNTSPTSPNAEYGYSGNGNLTIDLSASTTNNSFAVNIFANNANTTYKMLFNNSTTTIALTTSNGSTASAIRCNGFGISSQVIIGGTGFTVTGHGGLISLESQSKLTVDSGTTLTMNSTLNNITPIIPMFTSGTAPAPITFINKGTIIMRGFSRRSGFQLGMDNTGNSNFSPGVNTISIENQGTIDVNMTISDQHHAPLSVPFESGIGQGNINITNTSTGLWTLTNSALFVENIGSALYILIGDNIPNVNITNNGFLNLRGNNTVNNRTGGSVAVPRASLINNGNITSNNIFTNWVVSNNSTGSFEFVNRGEGSSAVIFNGGGFAVNEGTIKTATGVGNLVSNVIRSISAYGTTSVLEPGGEGYGIVDLGVVNPTGPAGKVKLQIAGTTPGVNHDQLTVISSGISYGGSPTVIIFGGRGSGAKGYVTVVGGAITAVTLVSGGSGYATPPLIAFSGHGTPTTATVLTAVLTGGVVSSVTIANPGAGYSPSTSISFINPSETNATASVAINGSGRLVPALLTGGTNYTTPPTVLIDGGTNTRAATFTANLSGGSVTSFNLNVSLSNLHLELPSLYTPTVNTTIPIVTTTGVETLSGAFASVTGLETGWVLQYDYASSPNVVNLVYTPNVVTFTWTGLVSSDWAVAGNWNKTGFPTAGVFPGGDSVRIDDIVVINRDNANHPIIFSGDYTIARLTISNTIGSTAGETLTINVGATLRVVSGTTTNITLNGGSIVNNGRLNVISTATGRATGIICGTPSNTPIIAREYGYSGSGVLNINVSASTAPNSAAIDMTAQNANTTYKMALNNSTTTFTLSSTIDSYAINCDPFNSSTASQFIISGTGFTLGSTTTGVRGGLLRAIQAAKVTIESTATLTLYSTTGNITNGLRITNNANNIPTVIDNAGTINIFGTTARSGLAFGTFHEDTQPHIINFTNSGNINVDIAANGVGQAPFNVFNNGGSAIAPGTVLNFTNTTTGVISLKNTATTVGGGQAIFCLLSDRVPPVTFNNAGALNLEGTSYSFGNKTTINNTGFISTNNELQSFALINNNTSGEISFFRNASTALTRQVVFNGLTTASAAGVGKTYTHGGFTFVVVQEKFTTGADTTLRANVLTSSNVVTASGTLTQTIAGNGNASIAFTSISITDFRNALVGNCTNAGTISTATGSDLNVISGIPLASTGTISPGGAGFGIANLGRTTATTEASTLRIQVAGNTLGVNHDQLVINSAGNATLSSMRLEITSLYTPTVPSVTIPIITFTGRTGEIAVGNITGINQIPGWAVVHGTNVVNLVYTDTRTWTGATSVDWLTPSNWSPTLLPTNNTDVTIATATNQPFLNTGNTHIRSITLDANTSVTVGTDRTITVTNGIINNGTLTFEDDSNLVQVSDIATTGSGTFIYKRNTPTVREFDYTYWSSPVADQGLAAISGDYAGSYYYRFDHSVDYWAAVAANTTMVAGEGYILRGQGFTNKVINAEFRGVPNNGTITTSSGTVGSSLLLGNPYPSAIDANTFLSLNSDKILGTIYFWTKNTAINGNYYNSDDYASYNATGGVEAVTDPDPAIDNKPNGAIAACQGFFATCRETGLVTFNNSMRLNAGTPLDNKQFYKTKASKKPTPKYNRVWLNLTNTQGVFKQTLLGYVTAATNNFDVLFDGESFDGNDFVDFYSINQNKNLTIQGRALPFNINDEVPLGYRSTIAGNFSISIDELDGFLTRTPLFLEDKLTNTVTNLKLGNYTFSTTTGRFDDRFVLKFNETTLSSNPAALATNQVLISFKNKQIQIDAFAQIIDKVEIYDLLGRQIYQGKNINSNTFTTSNLDASFQTLIVKTSLQTGKTVTEKVVF